MPAETDIDIIIMYALFCIQPPRATLTSARGGMSKLFGGGGGGGGGSAVFDRGGRGSGVGTVFDPLLKGCLVVRGLFFGFGVHFFSGRGDPGNFGKLLRVWCLGPLSSAGKTGSIKSLTNWTPGTVHYIIDHIIDQEAGNMF